MEGTPQAIEPQLEAPPILEDPSGRHMGWYLWSIVALFIGLLAFSAISNSLAGSADPKETAERKIDEAITSFRLSLVLTHLTEMSPSDSGRDNGTEKATSDSFRNSLDEYKGLRATDERVMILKLAAYQEMGEPAPQALLNQIQNLQTPLALTAQRVYSPEKLSPIAAQDISLRLGSSPIEQIMNFHALKRSGNARAYERVFGNSASQFLWIAFLLLSMGIFGFLAWINVLVARKAIRPQGHPIDEPITARGGFLGTGFVLCFIGFILFNIAGDGLQWVMHIKRSPVSDNFIGAAASLLFLVVLFVSLSKLEINGKSLLKSLNQSTFSVFRQIQIGFLAACANIPVIILLTIVSLPLVKQLNPSHPINEEFSGHVSPLLFGLILIGSSIVAPIWEEIAFRGLLFRGLLKLTNRVLPSMIITGLSFAIIHPQGPSLILVLGWIGFMGCVLTYYTRSVIPAIVMHCVHNTVLMFFALVSTNAV